MKISIAPSGVAIDDRPATVKELEQLIRELALARSKLDPPVPRESAKNGDQTFQLQFEPNIEVSTTQDGRIHLGFRHTGIGWCRFVLSQRQAAFLRDGLIKRTAGAVIDGTDKEAGGKLH